MKAGLLIFYIWLIVVAIFAFKQLDTHYPARYTVQSASPQTLPQWEFQNAWFFNETGAVTYAKHANIAVLTLHKTILLPHEYFKIMNQIEKLQSSDVLYVVARYNHGGSLDGALYILDRLKTVKAQKFFVVDGFAHSAAAELVCGFTEVYLNGGQLIFHVGATQQQDLTYRISPNKIVTVCAPFISKEERQEVVSGKSQLVVKEVYNFQTQQVLLIKHLIPDGRFQ